VSGLARPDVVVVGTVSLDLVADSLDAATARAAVGNSGANIAVRLAQAGLRTSFVCLIGADPIGDLVLDDLARWGVGTEWIVRRPDYRTPIVYQVTTGGGTGSDVIFSPCPQCGRPRGSALLLPDPDELPPAAWDGAAGARAVVTDVASATGARLLRAGTALTWYEASLREATIQEMVGCAAQAEIVKVSDEDADFYAPVLHQRRGRTRLHLLTRGSRGVDWRRPGEPWHNVPTRLATDPVDTIGAGDAFTAGAIAQLLGDGSAALDHEAALAAGAELAARACLAVGARGDMTPPSGSSPWIREHVPFGCGRCEDAT
jgi:fructokinase